MARPTKFNDLTTTSVTIERDMLNEAKRLNINISDVLKKALAEVLNTNIVEKRKEKPKLEKMKIPKPLLKKMESVVAMNPEGIPNWANILNNKCGMIIKSSGYDMVTSDDILEYINR